VTEFVLCTLGTRGDVEPFVSLAAALTSRSYGVTALANENWKEDFQRAGATFRSIAPEDESQSGRDDYKFFIRSILPSFRESYDCVSELVSRKSVALVYRANMLGMECAAESFTLPNVRVVLQPSSVKSYLRPPWPLSTLTESPFRSLSARVLVPAIYCASEAFSRYRLLANLFRKSVGVRPVHPWGRHKDVADLTLLFCPGWFAMPQADWPSNLHMVGFPAPRESSLHPELRSFIADRGAPLVFTPGTGVSEVKEFFERATKVAECLGLAAVFLSKHYTKASSASSSIICHPYAELAPLLQASAALIHHGGIGTTAQAIFAGIPQMIVPDRFDQPDNAMRVACLGLGSVVLGRKFCGADWASLLDRTMSSTHVKSQLATARELLRSSDAIATSVKMIEKCVGCTSAYAPQVISDEAA